MRALPFRQQQNVILTSFEIFGDADGFAAGIACTMPPEISLELFLQDDHSIPDVAVVETAVLVKPLLLLADGKVHLAGFRNLQNAQRYVESRLFLWYSANIDADCAHSTIAPLVRQQNVNFIEKIKYFFSVNEYLLRRCLTCTSRH